MTEYAVFFVSKSHFLSPQLSVDKTVRVSLGQQYWEDPIVGTMPN